MKRFNKVLAIGSAVVAGPLLATTAVAIRNHMVSGPPTENDAFALDSVFVDPNAGDCVGADICVDGHYPWINCQQGDHWCFDTRTGGGDGGGGGGCSSEDPDHCDNPGGGGGEPPTDCDLLDINDHFLAAGDPSVQPTLIKLVEQIRLAMTRLGGLPADSKFIYPDGSFVTTSELYRLLSRADFEVIRQPVPYDPTVPNNGSYGYVELNGGDPIYHTEISWLEQSLAAQDGLQWWIFHELSHITEMGQADWNQYSSPNSDGGTAMTPIEYAAGERFANLLQIAIRNALGFPPATNSGVDPSAAPRYDPGSGSSGPTVAQVETTCAAP